VDALTTRRLSDFRFIGCNPTAAVHFLPSFWPIATAMSQQIRQKLPSLGSNLATPLFENASMPKVRQPPRLLGKVVTRILTILLDTSGQRVQRFVFEFVVQLVQQLHADDLAVGALSA